MITNQHFSNFESFKNYIDKIKSPIFNIVSVNIRSISAVDKFNKFKVMISKFPKLPSIIAVQETWFCTNLEQIYNIPGYNVVHCSRDDNYGGTSIYIQKCFQYSIEMCESKDFINTITISIENHKIKGKPLKITSFYRSQKCDFIKFSEFIETLVTSCGRYPSVIIGDSNIDFLKNRSSVDIINILTSFNYNNCHTMITRPESGTSIDNVYSNIAESLFIDTIDCNLSDHNLISCKLKSQTFHPDFVETSHRICDYNKAREILNNHLLMFEETGNPSTDSSQIINYISNAAHNATMTKNDKKLLKNELTPWINKNLQSLMLLKNKLLKARRKRRSADIENRLKRISYIIKKSCRELMNNYYYNNLEKIQQEPKKCWKFLNENLGRKVKSQINVKDSNGVLVVDNQIKSDLFNRYFLEIPRTLKQQINCLPNDSCNAFRTLTNCQTLFNFSYTTILEIEEIISELNLTKSCGCDGISPRMLFECKDLISPYLSRIFNRIVNTSIYPDELKIAKIVPIPKECNALTIEKFRPIALLPIIDKIFEKILHKQLYSYLDGNGLLYSRQYGFKKGCGTEEAVVNVVNNICHGLDNGFKGVAGIFYDFSKAFDLVEHTILIQKLRYYGVNGTSLSLLKNYLTDRKQYVEVDNYKSFTGPVEYGVPQGSVLGPLLFTIYLNDIANLGLFGKFYMYADDICLLYPYINEVALKVHMERDAAIISEYARLNKLVLNAEKTKLLRFRPYLLYNQTFSIFIDGKEVLETCSTRYLGINLQNNLSWDIHIQTLKTKIVSVIGLLYKFKNKFNTQTKLIIYKSLIHSHLNYLPIIYAYKRSNELKSLQRIQNKALKVVFNLPLMYSTISLFKNVSLAILPVYGLYRMQLLLYVFKSLHNIGYHTISFVRNQTVHNTRNNMNLRTARCRLETTKQRVEYMGSLEFNNLPQNIKNVERISIFKRRIKEYLLQNLEMLLL